MTDLVWLLPAFVVIAAAYASVGLGGATSYAAVLSVTTIAFWQIPPLVLTLNLLVAGSAFRGFRRAGRVPGATLLPLLWTSVPAAFVGGLIPLRERQFVVLMSVALFVAGVRFLLGSRLRREGTAAHAPTGRRRRAVLMAMGAGIGLLAGMTGIGGGVYLGPILLLTGMSDWRATPAITSAFVFFNSASGLTAQLTRLHPDPTLWIPLACAVVVGAVIGNTLSIRWLSAQRLQSVFGVVLIVAALLKGVKAL